MQNNPLKDIIYGVKATKEFFKEKHTRVSWSNFDNFQTCQGLWFSNFYLRPPEGIESIPLPKESSRAIPGTVIQKVMEVFINDRVYLRPEMTSKEKIIEWMQRNSKAVFYLSKFAADLQFAREFVNPKKFWETNFGKNHWHQIYTQYHLDPAIKEVNLSFINSETFENIYGTEESFLNSLNAIYPQIVDTLLEENIYLNRVMSEVNLKVNLKGFELTGTVDFLFNPEQKDDSFFTTLSQLENGYFLFDGKYNITSYTKKEQLFFYAYLIYLQTKKFPKRLALLQWNKTKFKDFVLDKDYPLHVIKIIDEMKETSEKIYNFLDKKQELNGLFFKDNFLKFNPGITNCQFCNVFSCCNFAKEANISISFDFAAKMQAKKKAKKAISLITPGTNDILL